MTSVRRAPAAAPRIPARRRWGQHFLTDPGTAERIVEAAGLRSSDTVIEVGPGEGALTRPILARARRLLAIEIDPLRVEKLSLELHGESRLRLLTGDVLERSFSAWLRAVEWEAPAVLLGNLPYNAAAQILLRSIQAPETIERAVATVQREVARRFGARPGSREYGYLSVRAAAFASARILFHLPPGAFRPRPKVTSSVLELVPRSPALDPFLRDRALALASMGFRSRRKTLVNALSAAGGRARWERLLRELGLDARARAEELSLEDYLALARLETP
ncbi:MAG: 16S rRNA (adenine(1518)-N(6)/adenine(1519)-N(6))-dimethyltransferase RsmA [Thermoanaerobaculia bacterium]